MKDYSYWISASRKQFKLLKDLKTKFKIFVREYRKFANISTAYAKKNGKLVDLQYNKVRDAKNECSSIMTKLGRLGDDMKHYSSENKNLMDKYMDKINRKHSKLQRVTDKL